MAKKIVAHVKKSDNHLITAAMLVVEAHNRVRDGAAGSISWQDWCRKNINLSRSRIRELERIGEANDPDAMLAQIRDQTARRVARHRMKKAPAKAGSPPPLRNGDDWSALIRNLDPERRELIRELIKWAHTAPLEAVRRILAEVTGDEVDLLYIPPHLDRRNAA